MDHPAPASNSSSPLHTSGDSSPFLTSSKIVVAVLIIIVGVTAGYFLSRPRSTSSDSTVPASDLVQSATEFGSTDTAVFSDTATGVIEAGGIKGEGTHHLTRPGGDSQTVYLISSILDLEEFVGKQVEIYGQTLKGRYASWLMDVGRVKILE